MTERALTSVWDWGRGAAEGAQPDGCVWSSLAQRPAILWQNGATQPRPCAVWYCFHSQPRKPRHGAWQAGGSSLNSVTCPLTPGRTELWTGVNGSSWSREQTVASVGTEKGLTPGHIFWGKVLGEAVLVGGRRGPSIVQTGVEVQLLRAGVCNPSLDPQADSFVRRPSRWPRPGRGQVQPAQPQLQTLGGGGCFCDGPRPFLSPVVSASVTPGPSLSPPAATVTGNACSLIHFRSRHL